MHTTCITLHYVTGMYNMNVYVLIAYTSTIYFGSTYVYMYVLYNTVAVFFKHSYTLTLKYNYMYTYMYMF